MPKTMDSKPHGTNKLPASTQQKRKGYCNLAKVISVQLNDIITPTLSFYFSYTLETGSVCGMCRVIPEFTQSNVSWGGT